MKHDIDDLNNKQLTKTDDLIVDLYSLEKGFLEAERHRQEIWDYIQYREGLLRWPSGNKEVTKSG